MRGYFEIGIYKGKTAANIGTLWRSAYQLNAAGIFTIGHRYPRQASDTVKAWRHVPLRHYETFEAFIASRPYDAPIVAVEMGGKPHQSFVHPERAIYLLGSEDNGLPKSVTDRCQHCIALEAHNSDSYNVAVAGSLVMYHREYLQ